MSPDGLLVLASVLLVVFLLTPPLGRLIHDSMEGRPTRLTPIVGIIGSFAMLAGRFGTLIPMLALAGSMAPKRTTPVSLGTLRTDSVLFGSLVVGTIVIVDALSYFAALGLGPIAEQLILNTGHLRP